LTFEEIIKNVSENKTPDQFPSPSGAGKIRIICSDILFVTESSGKWVMSSMAENHSEPHNYRINLLGNCKAVCSAASDKKTAFRKRNAVLLQRSKLKTYKPEARLLSNNSV
jgi:hypothetical protein